MEDEAKANSVETHNAPMGITPKLAAALSKAQGEMTNPPKSKTVKVKCKDGSTYSYSYCPLEVLLDHVRPVLAKHGLSISQIMQPARSGQDYVLLTILMHESGEYAYSSYPIPYGLTEKERGSAITYARRYSLAPIVGVSAETDTDAEELEAMEAEKTERRKEEAALKMEQLKKQGKLTSAYTGEKIPPKADSGSDKANTDIKNAADVVEAELKKLEAVSGKTATSRGAKSEAKAEPEAKQTKKEEAKEESEEPRMTGKVDDRIQQLLARDHIGLSALAAWGVKRGNWTADLDLSKMDEALIKAIVKNWDKIKTSIRGGN